MDILKTVKTGTLAIFAAMLTLLFTSCDSLMFDDEGDCVVKYKMMFRYNMNLKWADAFPSEVKSVNLYVFDSNGVFVKEYTAQGEALSRPGYYMDLDLPAGDYKFVAWCGLRNEGAKTESFTVPQPVAGITTVDELTCSLNTRQSGNEIYSDTRLYFLYHGSLEANLPDSQDGQEYVYLMDLTKDTNHIRIILQELSSEEGLNADDYEICIEDANGLMAHDNALIGDTKITYLPWAQQPDEVGVGKVDVTDGTSIKYVKGLVADLSVARLMATHRNDLMLTIRSSQLEDRKIIARVPLIQYALMSKEYYEMAYGHAMTDQEFLDREDEYVMTFFLYQNKWMDAYIDIHSWRVVLSEYDVKG